MTYKIAALACFGMTLASFGAGAQPAAQPLAQPAAQPATVVGPATDAAAPRKPVLQVKPVLWRPKAISKSQVRPILKPEQMVTGAAADEAFVPASQVNALPVQMSQAAAVSAPAPIQFAAAHAGVPTAEVSPAPNELPAATVADFKGRYLGAGVEVALAPTQDEPPRRMSLVVIDGDAQQFTVKWATMKLGANFKPEAVKATEQALTFRPSGAPNRYVAVAEAPDQPAPDATATIDGRAMVVMLTTKLPDGTPSIQRYERALTETGMNVKFTRSEKGALVRQVNLTLTKSASGVW